ncbi:unnamed protein product [Leptidea sinapis]|uniref:Uncharacterized protein n=1 Tax=Leptidea sinapis TaxID=189913 RepID=A0A5E4PSF7_9NEOP|nr:unnamed protein product [Leptidea sinapis]
MEKILLVLTSLFTGANGTRLFLPDCATERRLNVLISRYSKTQILPVEMCQHCIVVFVCRGNA